MSDNEPQFSSQDFSTFSIQYGFEYCTSSPNYPQSNSKAEQAVKTIKALLSKSDDDPLLALLKYRSTPLHNSFRPAKLLMGRKLRTILSAISKQFEPKLPNKQVCNTRRER